MYSRVKGKHNEDKKLRSLGREMAINKQTNKFY